MPAALKTPLLEPDFAPDNPAWNHSSAPAQPDAPAAPSDAAAARAASAGAASASRVSSGAPAPERDVSPVAPARPVRSRPSPAVERSAGEPSPRLARSERRHRRFRPTITAVLCGGALLGQLVLLLWLHGKTLSSARAVEKMDAQIADVSNHIERTQERIAAFDSSPQIKQWAAQKGWKLAEHGDFDDTTKPGQARAAAQAQAEAQAQVKSHSHSSEADSR